MAINIFHTVLRMVPPGLDMLSHWISERCVSIELNHSVKERLKLIDGGYNGSRKEFRRRVLSYWKKYGVRPQKRWFDLYCCGMDSYDPRFITDPIWVLKIRPYFNKDSFRDAYADKCMFSRILPEVKKPETIVKNIAGYYYNGDGEQLISFEKAVSVCEQESHLIIKPSGMSKGDGILFYDKGKTDTAFIRDSFLSIGRDFVVQRIVKQHIDLAKLNETSLNSVRVISFHFKDEIMILSAQLRIGGTGSRVDNVSAGGCAVAINPDGSLFEKSVTRKSNWTDTAPNGMKFKDIKVPNYQGIIDTVRMLHKKLPYFNIVGWDFAVGEDGTPIMVEYNVRPGQNQIGCGAPTFGAMTEEVLNEVFCKKAGPHFTRTFHEKLKEWRQRQ